MKILISFLLLFFSLNVFPDQLCGPNGMAFRGIKKCIYRGMLVRRADIYSNKRFKVIGLEPYFPGGAMVILETGTSVRHKNPMTKGGFFPMGTEPVQHRAIAP
jgi:hypothetical protein